MNKAPEISFLCRVVGLRVRSSDIMGVESCCSFASKIASWDDSSIKTSPGYLPLEVFWACPAWRTPWNRPFLASHHHPRLRINRWMYSPRLLPLIFCFSSQTPNKGINLPKIILKRQKLTDFHCLQKLKEQTNIKINKTVRPCALIAFKRTHWDWC